MFLSVSSKSLKHLLIGDRQIRNLFNLLESGVREDKFSIIFAMADFEVVWDNRKQQTVKPNVRICPTEFQWQLVAVVVPWSCAYHYPERLSTLPRLAASCHRNGCKWGYISVVPSMTSGGPVYALFTVSALHGSRRCL